MDIVTSPVRAENLDIHQCRIILQAWRTGIILVAFGAVAVTALLHFFPAGSTEAQVPSGDEAAVRVVLNDLYEHQRQGMMNVPPTDGAFLRVLAAASRSARALEIGTSNGYSGIWISLGLRENGGKLVTIEKDAKRAALARDNFKRAGFADAVQLIEGDALDKIPELAGPFEFVFIDASKQDYSRYLEMVYPKVSPGGVIAAHNVVSHAGEMKEFLEKLKTYPDLETVFVLEKGPGISVSYKKKPWPKAQ